MRFSIDVLNLAELRYFDEEHNGIELSKSQSLGILVPFGDRYFNLFNPGEEYPVFARSKFYSSSDSFGVDFGTKMKHVSGECSSGPCWVLIEEDFRRIFGKDFVYYEELEDYVLHSLDFFKDRELIARKRISDLDRPVKMMSIISKDKKDIAKMNDFFEQRGHAVQKVKKG